MPKRNGCNYKAVSPDVPCRVTLTLDVPVARILSQLQDSEQQRRDEKVPVRRLITEIITGKVKLSS